jgi:alpha-1,6-mannosyltransferase
MKIIDIAEFYSEQGGGVRTYVRAKLAAGARAGHEILIIAPGKEDKEEDLLGGRVVWVKAPPIPFDPRYHLFMGGDRVRAVLEREQPDVLEGSSPWRGGWIAAKWRGSAVKVLIMHADPVAVYPHTAFDQTISRATIDRLFGWFWSFLRRLNANFDATIVAGEGMQRRFESFGLTRVHAVSFGVDRTIFRPGLRDLAVRRAMLDACGLPETARLAITSARHHPEKRLPVVMEAVARANRGRALEDQIGLYMIGDGMSRAKMDLKAATIPQVHIAGQVADRQRVATFLASADVLLHGSGSETYGLAIAEALCCGTPIVVPDQGGAADFAGPGYSEVYATGNADAAADALTKLLSQSEEDLRAAAHGAAAANITSADTHFEKLFALYEKLAREKKQT